MVGGDRRSPPRHKAKGGGGKGKGSGSNEGLSVKLVEAKLTAKNGDVFHFGGCPLEGNLQQVTGKKEDLHSDNLQNEDKCDILRHDSILDDSIGSVDGSRMQIGLHPITLTPYSCSNTSWAAEVDACEALERETGSPGGGANSNCMVAQINLHNREELQRHSRASLLDRTKVADEGKPKLLQVAYDNANDSVLRSQITGMDCEGLTPTPAVISHDAVHDSMDCVKRIEGGWNSEISGQNGGANSAGLLRDYSCSQGVRSLASTGQSTVNAYVKTAILGEETSAVCGIAASNSQETALNMQNRQGKNIWNSPMVPTMAECAKQVGDYGLKLKSSAVSTLPKTHLPNAWKRSSHLKVNTMELGTITNNGRSVSFDEAAYERNKRRLENGLVGKLFCRKLPLHILDQELNRRWSHVGGFRTILIGGDCFLCIFETMEARDNILMGGPWQIMGQLIGMEKWSPEFNPELLTGFSSPVWVRLPKLPLLYWDNITIARIASMIGEPLWIDAQTTVWGRCEYARVCIRIDLSKSLPTGIWIQGKQAEFFQAVEYEGISLLCFRCGIIGHKAEVCQNRSMVTSTRNAASIQKTNVGANGGAMEEPYPSSALKEHSSVDQLNDRCTDEPTQQVPDIHDSAIFVDQEDVKKYGPWILVSRKRKSQPKSGKKFTPNMIGKPAIPQMTHQAEAILESQQVKVHVIDEQIDSNVHHSEALLSAQQMDIATVEPMKNYDASLASSSRKGKSRISKAHFEKELLQLGPIALKSRKRKKKVTIIGAEQCLRDFTQETTTGGGDASPSSGK